MSQVNLQLLHEAQVTETIQLLHEVVTMVTEDSKQAIGYCVSFHGPLNTPTTPRALTKAKLTEGIEHEKVCF